MKHLEFERIELSHRALVNPYFRRYGEGSCQHSFASMYCLAEKYGDAVCERDGWLYTLRTARCTEQEKIYLFPMGNTKDCAGFSRAIDNILADAHGEGKLVRFETLTPTAKELLEDCFPGRFSFEALRDYAEYIYTYEKLAELPGHDLKKRRNDLSNFYRTYENRYRIERIKEQDIAAVRSFQNNWLNEQLDNGRDSSLRIENGAIERGLDAYGELGLDGILVYVDERLEGYTIGAGLSEDYFDAMFEKGSRSIPNIYRILNTETVRRCCSAYKYINREEDVGDMGLRKAKLAYRPDILLMKYRACER
jgi:hypothetical protein